MTLIKLYECDICKKEAEEDMLLEVRIEGRRIGEDKHAHKECLIKVGLLTEQEPISLNTNAFLGAFKVESAIEAVVGTCPKCDNTFPMDPEKDPEDVVCPHCGYTYNEPSEPHVGSPVT